MGGEELAAMGRSLIGSLVTITITISFVFQIATTFSLISNC